MAKNTSEINSLKEENKNLKIAISDNQDDIDKINNKINENNIYKKMSTTLFNKKYRTNIGYEQVKALNLDGCYLGNIALKDLCEIEFKHLEKLLLSGNNISDITPLQNAKFPQLKELILFFNNIRDIEILKIVNFRYLTYLGLSDNSINDINVLKDVNFLQLEKLALSSNNLKDINVLWQTNFRFLRELRLSNNEISDISILKFAKFEKLKSLILSNNYIKSIDILGEANFPILLELKLSNNKITDISELQKAKFRKVIKKLYLSHNNISQIDSLICSSCYSDWEVSKSHLFLERRRLSHTNCCFQELNELKIAVNYIDREENKDKINYLKSHIHLVII